MCVCDFQNIKEGLEGHAVDWYSEVFDVVFPDVDAEQVNKMWKEQLKEVKPERKERKKRVKKEEEEDDEDSSDDD